MARERNEDDIRLLPADYLLLDDLNLEELDINIPELQLKNLLKIIQNMWPGIQNMLSNQAYIKNASESGIIKDEEKQIIISSGNCISEPFDVSRCFTSRNYLNYIFSELVQTTSERMEVENDPYEITVTTYSLYGPQFPDHTFITIESKESLYLLQSFYYQYSFRSLYGLSRIKNEYKDVFKDIISHYEKYDSTYQTSQENVLEIESLNNTFKVFTGIDTDRHSVYKERSTKMIEENNSLISQGMHPVHGNFIKKQSKQFSLLFYTGSLSLKIFHMLQMISLLHSKNILNPQFEIKQFLLYRAYLKNNILGDLSERTLTYYSGYDIQHSDIQENKEIINILYKNSLNWVKEFYFYVTQLNRLIKSPIIDLSQDLYQKYMFYREIIDPISFDLKFLERGLNCVHISLQNIILDYQQCDFCILYAAIELSLKLGVTYEESSIDRSGYQRIKQIIEIEKEKEKAKNLSKLSFKHKSMRKSKRKSMRKSKSKSMRKSKHKSMRKSKRKSMRKSKRKSMRKSKSKSMRKK